jgi:hypothetical protein
MRYRPLNIIRALFSRNYSIFSVKISVFLNLHIIRRVIKHEITKNGKPDQPILEYFKNRRVLALEGME